MIDNILDKFRVVRKAAINITISQATLTALDGMVDRIKEEQPTANRSLVIEHLLLEAMATTD